MTTNNLTGIHLISHNRPAISGDETVGVRLLPLEKGALDQVKFAFQDQRMMVDLLMQKLASGWTPTVQ